MSSSKYPRLLLPAFGIAILLISVFALSPAVAQTGDATATATAGATEMVTSTPAAGATQAVPATGAQAMCFTYNDLANVDFQSGGVYYVVNSGDTLAGIAQHFGIAVNQLMQANSFVANLGQATQAPQAAGQAGALNLNDCLVKGASNQVVDQGQVNGQNYVLLSGTILRIPVSISALIPQTGAQPVSPTATAQPGQVQIPQTGLSFALLPGELGHRIFLFGADQGTVKDGLYVVRTGETLGILANRWGVKISDILAVNPQIENANMLFPGEGIHVPRNADLHREPNAPILTHEPTEEKTSQPAPTATSTPSS